MPRGILLVGPTRARDALIWQQAVSTLVFLVSNCGSFEPVSVPHSTLRVILLAKSTDTPPTRPRPHKRILKSIYEGKKVLARAV